MNKWNDIIACNRKYLRRSRLFVAALALNQNQPAVALNILDGESRKEETNYITARQIRLIAWSRMHKFDGIIDMLHGLLEEHKRYRAFKPHTSRDVLNEIEQSLKESGAQLQLDAFGELRKELEKKKFISESVIFLFISSVLLTKLEIKQMSYGIFHNYRL